MRGVRMRRVSSLLLGGAVLASLLAVAGEARAVQVFRCPAPGTVIEFTSVGRITFGGQDGFWCFGTDASGKSSRLFAMLVGPGSGSRYAPYIENHVERIWPLEIGKQIGFSYQGSQKNIVGADPTYIPWIDVKIAVTRHEPVTVQAGTFDAWLIEVREAISGGGLGPGALFIWSVWYAPDPGYVVKLGLHIQPHRESTRRSARRSSITSDHAINAA